MTLGIIYVLLEDFPYYLSIINLCINASYLLYMIIVRPLKNKVIII